MIVELKNVGKVYETPELITDREVLGNINLIINSGDSIAVSGPSGSGKSTLLNIIGTLDKPSSGNVVFNRTDISGLDQNQLANIRNQKIGFIFQFHHLLPQLTLMENILLPVIPQKKKLKNSEITERAMGLIDTVGLADRIYQHPGQLSGGECQRAAVVRALINQPDLILADEPTGSLDQESARQLGDLLSEMNNKHNVALVVVTHSQELAEKMRTIYNLENGKLNLIK